MKHDDMMTMTYNRRIKTMSNIHKNIPGPIRGNPLQGLVERVSIQVEKVFSSCISRDTMQGVELHLHDVKPEHLHAPFKFLTGGCAGTAKLENLIVTDLAEEKCTARVSTDVVIPVEITFVDKDGVRAIGKSNLKVAKDVIMKVPAPSITPYEVKCHANVVMTDGEFIGEHEIKITACVTIILEIVINVQLLVPSYGYTFIPPCQKYTEEVCSGAYELPIYPEDCNE